MLRYSVWGVELGSDIRLPSLRPADQDPSLERHGPLPLLRLVESAEPLGDPPLWLYTEMLGETTRPWRAVGLSDRGYFVRLHGAVDFLLEGLAPAPGEDGVPKVAHDLLRSKVRAGAPTIARFFVHPEAEVGAVEPLFLEQALPLWLSLLGRPCLHASAVAWGDRAIAFAGRSGSGKSTLATRLAASREQSDGLVSDDCLVLEIQGDRLLAHPGHRAVRLLEDSAHALFTDASAGDLSLDGMKRRIDVRAADLALPLARFYTLEPGAERARVTSLRPRDALARLATHLFRVDPEDYRRLPAELDLLDRMAARVTVKRLEVPRRYDALDEVKSVIEEDLASEEGPSVKRPPP